MRAEDALQLPFADLMDGDLSPLAYNTRFGLAFVAMSLGYAVVAALLFLGRLLDRREPLRAAFAVGLGFSPLATLLIGAIAAAGAYLSVQRLPHLSDLWSESYGQVLLVKLALVSTALVNSGPPALPESEHGIAAAGRR